MNTRYILPSLVISLILAMSGCRDFDYSEIVPSTKPVINSISFDPSAGVLYGDSVTLLASVQDKTPLSTLQVEIVINDEVVNDQSIRTKGQAVQVSQKLFIPLVKGAEDGSVTMNFTLTNVEGGETTFEQQIAIQRPQFDTLYLRMSDGSTLTMTKDPENSHLYQTEEGTFSSSITAKVLSKIDYSGFNWVGGDDGIILGDEFSSFITLNDPTVIPHRIVFDVVDFRLFFTGEQLPSVNIAGTILLPGSDGLFRGTISLTNRQEVTSEGIDNFTGAIDPDFFSLSDGKVYFEGASGQYIIAYDKTKNFILVEQANMSFPNALWVCGEGMGKPVSLGQTTSGWGWDNAYQYFFCNKVDDYTYELTVYLSGGNFKFFKEKGWGGGEFRLDTGFDYISPEFTSNGDGNYVLTSDPGIYRLIIELKTEGHYRFLAQKIG